MKKSNRVVKGAVSMLLSVPLLFGMLSSAQAYDYESILKKLQPGSNAYVYGAESSIVVIYNPYRFTDFSTMKQKAGTLVTLPEQLWDGFTFTDGFIQSAFTPTEDDVEQELQQLATKTHEPVVFKEIKASDQFQVLSITYKNKQNDELFFNVTKHAPGNALENYVFGNSEGKLKVNNREALYVTYQSPVKGEMKQIKWLDPEKNVIYTIGSSSPSIGKNDLLQMAGTIQ